MFMRMLRLIMGVVLGLAGVTLIVIGVIEVFTWMDGGWWIPLPVFCAPGFLLIYAGYRIATGGKKTEQWRM